MGIILVVLAFLVAALGTLEPSRAARADIQNDVFQVLCMPELDVLEVRQLDVTQEAARRFIKQHDQAIADARHLYVPDWHARLDVDPADPSYGIVPTRFDCPLASGPAELVILPEPIPELGNSIAVTLRVNGKIVVDDVPFILCAKGGPITGLTYVASMTGLIVAGNFGGTWLDEAPREKILDAIRRSFHVEPSKGSWGRPLEQGRLRPIDIDYHGIDYDKGEGPEAETCRYKGPGSPRSRSQ